VHCGLRLVGRQVAAIHHLVKEVEKGHAILNLVYLEA
jgi:hypothetical protein